MPISQGNILVALPFLNDGGFKRTVILLAEHSAEGSLGFIMNKPMHLTLKDVLATAKDITYPVYYGGPVSQNQLFYIHTCKYITGSIHIHSNYYWGGSFTELLEGIKSRSIATTEVRFFIGYAGWGAGQLQNEMKEKTWGLLDAHAAELINKHPEDIWPQQLSRLGDNYKVFANISYEPSLN